MTKRTGFIAGLFLALASLSFTAAAEFCWKETETRGAGKIPTKCGTSQQNDAGLCYPNCPSGYGGAGPVCWGKCPSNMTDHGAGCSKPGPYGVGGGYPWKFGDALNDNGMFSRCRAANSQGCEKNGAIVYPKCKSGYHKVGCCICSPDCPSGYADSGATCIKPTKTRGAGTIPTGCDSGLVNSGGLCYPECKWGGSAGWGPVCWRQCPASVPVECGLGCAKDMAECINATVEQVMTVTEFVINLAIEIQTGGAGMGFKAMTSGGKSSFIALAKAVVKSKAVKGLSRDTVKKALKDQFKGVAENQIENLTKVAMGEDFDFYSLDPTGIAPIVKAYNKKICVH